jgi:type IV/VI secretion system ImpK/VasF family protein
LTLFELARELFTYLVRFREKAPSTSAPPLPEVRRDLLGIFARMDNQAKRDPLLIEPYHQVHYALVALADEIVLTSGWEHSPAWRQALLEERFYNTQQAGRQFFELANKLENAPQDVVAIFYLCLALGFSGRYAPADHELAEVKERLLARLPSKPRIMEEPPNTRSQKDRRVRGWLWSTAAAAVLLAVAVFGWNHWQALQAPPPGVATAPASKPAPAAPQAKPEDQPKPNPDQVQQAAVPVKTQERPQAKAEPGPQPEPAANAEAEPKPTPQASPRAAPTPSSQPKAEPATKQAPKTKPPEKPEAKATAQPVAQEKATEPPDQTPQPAATAQPSPPSPKTATQEKSYRVRVGVYVGPIQSGRFADQLKQAGFPASIEKLDRPGGKVLYVVSITPLPGMAEAERVRSEIKLKFNVKGVIKEN